MTKQEFLKLTGREATKYAWEKYRSGLWTQKQMNDTLEYWKRFNNWEQSIKDKNL